MITARNGSGNTKYPPVTPHMNKSPNVQNPTALCRSKIIRFQPTLSPVDLIPEPERLDEAIGWGEAAVERELPLIRAFLEPVAWED